MNGVLEDHLILAMIVQKSKFSRSMISGCSVTVHTDENDIYLWGGKSHHEHESSSDFIKTTRLRHQMKQHALNKLTPINARGK
jgi:hypothetical protein